MRNSMILMLVCSALLAAAGGCSKKKDDGAAGATSGEATTNNKAAAGPVKTTPGELIADFRVERKGPEAIEFLNKYREGATFTAPVKSVGTEESGDPIVMLDGGDGTLIAVGFADPAAAKAKGYKAGDSVTVTCEIGGLNGKLMQVIDCK